MRSTSLFGPTVSRIILRAVSLVAGSIVMRMSKKATAAKTSRRRRAKNRCDVIRMVMPEKKEEEALSLHKSLSFQGWEAAWPSGSRASESISVDIGEGF